MAYNKLLEQALVKVTRTPEYDWLAVFKPIVTVLEKHRDPAAQKAGQSFHAGLGVLSAMRKELDADTETLSIRATEFMAEGMRAWMYFSATQTAKDWVVATGWNNHIYLLERLGDVCLKGWKVLSNEPGAVEALEKAVNAFLGTDKDKAEEHTATDAATATAA